MYFTQRNELVSLDIDLREAQSHLTEAVADVMVLSKEPTFRFTPEIKQEVESKIKQMTEMLKIIKQTVENN